MEDLGFRIEEFSSNHNKSRFSNETFLITIILFIHSTFLLYGVKTLSISHSEAWIFFDSTSFVHYLVRFSTSIFGQNDFGLRIPFVFFHILSTILLYKLSKQYLKRKSDRVFSVIVYLLLPGTNSAALLVNSAEIVIFLSLLFIYLYENKKYSIAYLILSLSFLVDNSFSIFYLSLIFYSIYKKDNTLLYFSLILFGISMYVWGLDIGGKPKNYFIDTLAVYSAIFSPLVFLYFFYTEYRILIKEKKNILWFISFVAFIFSLLLSFRQKIRVEDFAPFAIIATPLMVRTFLSSYRVRIPELRGWHKFFFVIVFSSLVINFTLIYFNKPLYLILSSPKKHFTYRYDFAKEIARRLKSMHIKAINSTDRDFALRLRFYGIKNGEKYKLTFFPQTKGKSVTISYYYKPVFKVYVSKLHE